MGETKASKIRSSQPATTKKQSCHISRKRVAKDQFAQMTKRATSASVSRRTQGLTSRTRDPGRPAEVLEPDLSGPGVPPNLDALASTLGHMYATVNSTLAPGQETAKYVSVYQHLSKHISIKEGTVIPQLLTSSGVEMVNCCCYSEYGPVE